MVAMRMSLPRSRTPVAFHGAACRFFEGPRKAGPRPVRPRNQGFDSGMPPTKNLIQTPVGKLRTSRRTERRQSGYRTWRRRRRMAFNVKQRGKLTYYYTGDRPVLSALVT